MTTRAPAVLKRLRKTRCKDKKDYERKDAKTKKDKIQRQKKKKSTERQGRHLQCVLEFFSRYKQTDSIKKDVMYILLCHAPLSYQSFQILDFYPIVWVAHQGRSMLVNEHSFTNWDLFPTENPRGALHWLMFTMQIVNGSNVNWLKDLLLKRAPGNKILVRLRGNTTRRASPCWTTSTPTARSVSSCFLTNIDVISFIIIVVFKISFLWAMTIYAI